MVEKRAKKFGHGQTPPIIRAMPERKRFFTIDVFPNPNMQFDLDGKSVEKPPSVWPLLLSWVACSRHPHRNQQLDIIIIQKICYSEFVDKS